MNESTNAKHEFAAMEEFLITFHEGHSMRKLFQFDLRDYFEKHPLTRENYDKIKATLKKLKHYDVICANFGIETEKISLEEYAAKNGISKKRAKMLFNITSCFTKDFAIKLYYMAIQPKQLRRYIFETQFELHNMMKAYDEITGKNTTCEHHVGVCDGPTLGRDLFNEGFDTLEEVQKADRAIIREDGYGLTARANSISKTLDRYGLKNTLWRGALQVVAGEPPFSKNPPIYAIEDYGEVKIFFRSKNLVVNVAAVKDTLNGLVFNGDCTGFDVDRITNGDIWVYFNPTRHDAYHRRHAIESVVEALLKNNNVFIGED